MVSRIITFTARENRLKNITFMVSHLLHLWLIVITFMVGITFMVDFCYIYPHLWLLLHLWMIHVSYGRALAVLIRMYT